MLKDRVKTMYGMCKRCGVYTHNIFGSMGLGKNYSVYTTTNHNFCDVFSSPDINNISLLGCGLYTSSTTLLYKYNEKTKGI